MDKYDPTITVCSKCLRSCCWHGEFMCDEALDASTVQRKISTLIRYRLDGMDGEHPDYWNDAVCEANEKLLTVNDLRNLGFVGSLELSPKGE